MKRKAFIWILEILSMVLPASQAAAREKSWVEIRSPHFRVYSDAGEKKARRLTHEFEKFHSLIHLFLPSVQAGPGNPTIVLAAENERTLRSLLPQYWEEKGKARPSGIFVGGPEKNYVALRIDLEDEYRYHVVYHEYVHLLLRLNYPRLPVWLGEGLAECLGYTAINDKISRVGEPSPERIGILRNEPMIPLRELFSVDHESPYYRDQSKVPMFYAQSWALTHMLFLGEKRAHMPKLLELLELARKRVPVEEATAQALGDPGELERQLGEYILNHAFYAFEIKTPAAADPEEYSARTVPSLEMRSLRGDFYVSMQLWPEAKQTLDSVLLADPDNAEALTSMGIYYAKQNGMKEAARFFVAAAAAGSESCITHYHAGEASMQSGNYAEAERSFRRAIELNPAFAPAYSRMAEVLAASEASLDTALEFSLKAIELEPGVLGHQLVMSHVLLRMNKVDLAIRYAEQVEAAAESARDRMEAGEFLEMARQYKSIGSRSGLEDEYENRDSTEGEHPEAFRSAGSRESASLEGTVSDVSCFDPAGMELVLDSGGNSHRLHVDDYYGIRFTAVDYKPGETFQPCTDLQGKRVVVEYVATPGSTYGGEIRAIGIYKSSIESDIPKTAPDRSVPASGN